MNIAQQLTGAWRLVSSIQSRDGVETHSFGAKPLGQIQYTADGRMSAFLMHEKWIDRGTTANATADFGEFFAYAGIWRNDGDLVHHDIEFCTIPARIGTCFTREINWLSADSIALLTQPETTKSGVTYITRLIWQRADSA